jgi:pimeloyl-ACP methyl ester carboxylesterase
MRFALISALGTVAILTVGLIAWLYAPDKPRAALETKYATPPSQFLVVDGVRLHVRDSGSTDAPAVILLHGFGSSLHTWEGWAQLLDADYRVVRFDLPGFGLTGPDPTEDYTDARSIDILIGLMNQLGISRASIIGNSMGGRIAWTFAALHPTRVNKLVLIAPDGFASRGHAYGVEPKVPLTARLLPYFLPMALVRASLRPAYGDPAAMTDARLERYRDMLLAPGVRKAIIQRMKQNILVEPEPFLQSIRAPTLLLWGQMDHVVPITNAADYERAVPHAKIVSFAGLGHLPQEEAPASTVAEIRAFLTR